MAFGIDLHRPATLQLCLRDVQIQPSLRLSV